MKKLTPVITHPWNLSEKDAIRLQRELSGRVVRKGHLKKVGFVAGVDVAYDAHNELQFAAAVVLDAKSLNLVEVAIAQDAVRFHYVSGLFAFRELPTIICALKKLKTIPDLFVCDGQGIAHPRRFGLASHLGVIFNIPTIGCGKKRLIGEAEEPGPKRGDQAQLIDKGEVIGCLLRTQDKIKPLYVSIGHLLSLRTACDWILRLTPRFRLPETTRQADQVVRRYRKMSGINPGAA